MSFESLAYLHEVIVNDFPSEWIPLTHLYDPDLPLYPLLYFHELDPTLPEGNRPGEGDRIFGFIQNFSLVPEGLVARIAINKDLKNPINAKFVKIVEQQIRNRLGLDEPIELKRLRNSFNGDLSAANKLLEELWYQVVDGSFGKSLPFGRMWDPVLGLARYVASWNSQGGRKGELIQTHYFSSSFGEKISTTDVIKGDFFLLPTFVELIDESNPLVHFPNFSALCDAAIWFSDNYCDVVNIEDQNFSSFNRQKANISGPLNGDQMKNLMNKQDATRRRALFENFNAFNRGPQRSVISLLMLNDLRRKFWKPEKISKAISSRMYKDLKGSYQTSKVIQLYLQQCFGIKHVLPIDNWVETFLRWPLDFGRVGTEKQYKNLFDCCDNLAEVERLIWLASQARKVHSSVASEILWCVRFGGPNKQMRGANPFSCKICKNHIRNVCPSYKRIEDLSISFDSEIGADFFVEIQNRKFHIVQGVDSYDEYSTKDRPSAFKNISDLDEKQLSKIISVQKFIQDF